MANNKVELSTGEVLIDLTSDTVTASNLLAGETAHNRSGEPVTGTVNLNNYVLKSGDTMTGPLNLTNSNINIESVSSEKYVRLMSSSGILLYLDMATSGHGLWSSGYGTSLTDGTTYTPSASWIIFRDSTGYVRIPKWGNTGTSTKPIYFNTDGKPIACSTSLTDYVLKSGDTMSGNLIFSTADAIKYAGTKATYPMIRFIDNTSDTYGNGIYIGGGGQTIIGGGESAGVMAAEAGTSGSEYMWIGNDSSVEIYTNLQNGWASRRSFSFSSNGDLSVQGKFFSSGGLYTSGRVYGSGDDEGIIVGYASNGYAGIILGGNTGRRSQFYLTGGASGTDAPYWGYNDGGSGSATYKVYHPKKSGTVALTSTSLVRSSWWATSSTNNVDDLRGGIVFAYQTNHNAPCTGTAVAFDCESNNNYTLQLMGSYNENKLYFRNRQGDSSTWNPWREVNSYTSILGNYYNRYGGYDASARIASANVASTDCAGIKTFLATSSMTTSKPATDGNIMHFEWDNGTRYSTQLAILHDSGRLQHRLQTGAGNTANDWSQWYSVYSEAYKPSWGDIQSKPTIGTVTSVGISGSKGISVSGSPITSSGTIDVSVSTSSGTASRNTTNTSAGEVKYQKYGRVVTIYTTAQITISSTGAALDKTYFTGLPKPPAMVTFTATGAGNKAVALQITTDGYIKGVYNAPPSGVLTIGTSYIAAS